MLEPIKQQPPRLCSTHVFTFLSSLETSSTFLTVTHALTHEMLLSHKYAFCLPLIKVMGPLNEFINHISFISVSLFATEKTDSPPNGFFPPALHSITHRRAQARATQRAKHRRLESYQLSRLRNPLKTHLGEMCA